jgi:hypothetical protein
MARNVKGSGCEENNFRAYGIGKRARLGAHIVSAVNQPS